MADLPRIAISALPEEEREVARALIETLGDDLAALAWQGSWARGEETPESDHDLLLVMRRMDSDIMGKLAAVFKERRDWSTYIKTEEELRSYPAYGRCQFRYGMVLVHGDFEPPPIERENLLADLRHFVNEISHDARYRVIHKAAPERATEDYSRHGRLLHYRAKEALLAMKSRELLQGRDYPLTREVLRERITDETELALIDLVDLWPEFRPLYEADFVPMALLLDRFARKLVSELPAQ